jgi:hypothetical protein
MDSTDKDDVVYAISKVEQAVETVDARLEDLTNEVRRIDMGIGGSSGILDLLNQLNKNLLDGLYQLNKNLTVIKWLVGALLLVAVFVLLKK